MMKINGEAFYSESEIEARHGLAALSRIRQAHTPRDIDTLFADIERTVDELGAHGVDTDPIKGGIVNVKSLPAVV